MVKFFTAACILAGLIGLSTAQTDIPETEENSEAVQKQYRNKGAV